MKKVKRSFDDYVVSFIEGSLSGELLFLNQRL
ncbi:DUF603 domain-containing protein [Borreliella garinii]|nr:DUF603 domain-containing protein [Borreliella garinii]